MKMLLHDKELTNEFNQPADNNQTSHFYITCTGRSYYKSISMIWTDYY